MKPLKPPFTRLRNFIHKRFPAARTETEVFNAGASLDIWLADYFYVVFWRPRTGFELMVDQDAVLGQQPDEAYTSVDAVQRRLETLLTSAERRSRLARSA